MNCKHVLTTASCGLALNLSAKTVAWYHFDEGTPGSYATPSMQITNAVDATKLIGTPGKRGTGVTDDYLPKYVDEFASYTYLVDPVAHTTNANHRSLAFKRGATSASDGRLGGQVAVASDASLSSPALTVEFFVRTDVSSGGTQWVAKRNGSETGHFTYSICLNAGKPYVNVYSMIDGAMKLDQRTGSGKFASSTSIANGVWHHVAMTIDPSKDSEHPTAKLYVDYALESTVTLTNSLLYVDSGDDGALYLGSSPMGYYTPGGSLDEVRISDTVLDESQFLRWTNVHTCDAAIRLSFDNVCDYTVSSTALYTADGQTVANEVRDATFAITTTRQASGALPEWTDVDLAVPEFYRGLFSREAAVANRGAVDFNVVAGTTKGLGFQVNDGHAVMSDDFTMECCFKSQSKPTAAAYFLKQSWWSGESGVTALQVYLSTDGEVTVAGTPPGGNYRSVKIGRDVCDDRWHHVAAVYDKASKKVAVYLDRTNVTSLTSFEIGTEDGGKGYQLNILGEDTTRHFDAVVDEYVITRRAMAPAEFINERHEPTTRLYVDFENNAVMQPPELYLPEGSVTADYASQVPGGYILSEAGAERRPNAKSLAFDGTSKSAQFPHTAAIELKSMTVEFFMRYEAADGYAGLVRFCQSDTTYTTSPIWTIGFNADATAVIMRIDTDKQTNQAHAFGNTFMDGLWHHLAVTFEPTGDGDTLVKMYDTTCRGEPVQVGGDWTVNGELNYDNGSCLGLGISPMSRHFTGNIDELRISEGVLAPSQFMKCDKDPAGLILIFR